MTFCAPAARALELEWQAPAGCPTTEAVKRDVKRLAGSAEGASLVARAAVTQTPDQRWRVAIDLSGSARGHRTLTADTCLQLARASALIIALAANPEAALDLPTDEPVGVPSAARSDTSSGDGPIATSTSPSTATLSSTPPPRPRDPAPTATATGAPEPAEEASQDVPAVSTIIRRYPWAVFAHAGLEHGALPTPTAWVGAGVRHHLRKLPLGIAISALVTQATSATYDNGIGADFRVSAVHALGCLQPHIEPWLVATCIGAQLGATHSRGHFRSGQVQDSSIAGAQIFAGYRWSVGPAAALVLGYELLPHFNLEMGAAIAVPATRWEYVVDGVGPLYRTAAQQLMLFAGLGALL